jgi:uncharacterized protein
MIERDLYLDQLRDFIDKPFIKVLTGIRRCGKSGILTLLHNELLKRGVPGDNIIYMNFESFEFSEIDDADKLYKTVKSRITNGQKYYILLDEVQEVNSWEKAVNAFSVDFNSDIYITGSNSHLLSSDLATYLTGRYIEINVYPLSFAEYLDFKVKRTHRRDPDIQSEFRQYLRLGGFPVLHTGDYTTDSAWKVVSDIYASAILRDTVQRHKIRNVELLERVVKYVFDNIGNMFSAKNVADFFKSQQRKIDLNTVYNFLNALEGAFIIYRIPRYDIKGKEILKTFEKYYVADHSLLYAMLGFRDRFISGVLENIVMLELKRRGFKVYTGKSGEKEIDFVAEKKERKVYIQVAYKLSEQSTIDREFKPLQAISDNFPKYVVTMEEMWQDNIEGIRHENIAGFLLLQEY